MTSDDFNLQRMAVESVRRRGFHEVGDLPGNAFLPLLSAQRMRFDEEWGEFNRALRKNEIQGMREELADVQIVLYQIAHILEINLASEVVKKLSADEKRGYLHGEKDNGQPSSLNTACDLDDEHNAYTDGPIFSYPTQSERLVIDDYAEGSGVE